MSALQVIALTALAAVAIFLAQSAMLHGHLLDDTFISLRYARNLVEGHGLVFNEGERVEGYTNFLYVVLSALLIRAGLDPLRGMSWVMLASSLGLMAVMASTERFLAYRDGRRARLPLSVVLALPLPAFAYWSVVSMETMLFTALLALALHLSLLEWDSGRLRGSAVAFALLTLTRPEGLLCFVLVTGTLALFESRERGAEGQGVRYLVNASLYGVPVAVFFLWRIHYYGSLFPNTFRAKVTGGLEQWTTGLMYLGDVALAFPLILAILPVSLAAALGPFSGHRSGRPAAFLAVTSLTFLGYTVWVGGDFMPHHRFFMPVLPIACVLAAWIIRAITPRSAGMKRRAVVLLGVVAINMLPGPFTDAAERAFVAHRTALVGTHVGKRLATELPRGTLIAVNTAGAVPYASRLPAIDMLGLTDENIARRPVFIVSPGWAAHRRGWGAYVLDRKPRRILFYNSAGSREPHYLSDHELADDPFFRFFYEPRVATLPGNARGGGGRAPVAWFVGSPFGPQPPGGAVSGELGVRFVSHGGWFGWTSVHEAPITLHTFDFAKRDETLWLLRERFRQRPGAFVEAAAAAWAAAEGSGGRFDPAARLRVEAMCRDAYGRIRDGDHATARRILTEAAGLNDEARSPLVYQYIANLAVITGDLFVAVGAGKEALRLDPENHLYARNLENLLRVPYRAARQGKQGQTTPGSSPVGD